MCIRLKQANPIEVNLNRKEARERSCMGMGRKMVSYWGGF